MAININPNNVEPTVTRIQMFLEDGEWDTAVEYCNYALDYFPTDSRLYLYLLFAENKVSSIDQLEQQHITFYESKYYTKVKRFASKDLLNQLQELEESTKQYMDEKKEQDRKEKIYKDAISAKQRNNYQLAVQKFFEVQGYKDSDEQRNEITQFLQEERKKEIERQKAEEERKERERIAEEERKERERIEAEEKRASDYDKAVILQAKANNKDDYKKALALFESISSKSDYKDSKERIKEINKKIEEIECEDKYNEAERLLYFRSKPDYDKALSLYKELYEKYDYKDSALKITNIQNEINKKKKAKKIKIGIIAAVAVAAIFLIVAITSPKVDHYVLTHYDPSAGETSAHFKESATLKAIYTNGEEKEIDSDDWEITDPATMTAPKTTISVLYRGGYLYFEIDVKSY